MPKELPRVELEHPSDLDFIINAVRTYAMQISSLQLREQGLVGDLSALEDRIAHALERVRTIHNLTNAVGICCTYALNTKRYHKWSRVTRVCETGAG